MATKPTKPDNCPHCNVSLIGAPIPEHINQPAFNKYMGKMWRPYGDATHWRREVGVEIRGAHDGVLFYQCPDCKGTWNRWPDTDYYRSLHDRAEVEMRKWGRRD
jgi:hypothetical protein